MRNWRFVLALVLLLVVVGLAAPPARADGVCPAPGTGIAGALNMIHDATMLTIPMAVDAPQGNAGMHTAVVNTACP